MGTTSTSWIDEYRREDGSIERSSLFEILPYGEDFLFIDQVVKLEPNRIESFFRVPTDSPLLRSHFRELSIMPGVLTGEGLAQSGAVLVSQHLPDARKKFLLAMKVTGADFIGVAQPGDRIDYQVELIKLGSRMARLTGVASVKERTIAKFSFVLAIAPRQELKDALTSNASSPR